MPYDLGERVTALTRPGQIGLVVPHWETGRHDPEFPCVLWPNGDEEQWDSEDLRFRSVPV